MRDNVCMRCGSGYEVGTPVLLTTFRDYQRPVHNHALVVAGPCQRGDANTLVMLVTPDHPEYNFVIGVYRNMMIRPA